MEAIYQFVKLEKSEALQEFAQKKLDKLEVKYDFIVKAQVYFKKEEEIMSRSVWKGPFVDPSLLKKVEKQKNDIGKKPIKTWARNCTIIPDFVGVSFLIHNGKKFIPIRISEDMVGHKLGEFSPTRQFPGHKPADKKAAQVAAAQPTRTTVTANKVKEKNEKK